MQMSQQGITLLQSIETLALQPYDDQTGQPIHNWVKGATIGYGHLIAQCDWSRYKDGITQPMAEDLCQQDLAPFIQTVNTKVKHPLTQQELDALVMLTFNIGIGNFSSSSALKLINDPSAHTAYPNLEAAWKAWNKSQGHVMRGLINRRQAEWDIYHRGDYHQW